MRHTAIVCLAMFVAATALEATTLGAAEIHVSLKGNDANPGTNAAPLRTIQRAADMAQPGDTITVHAGTYRERVNPPRGGESDAKRIVYQAAPGEKVEIKGSEVVKDWTRVQDGVWKTELPNAFFGGFNPYGDLLRGDWFSPRGREHHTGAVYVNGPWLVEAAKLDDVLAPGETAADAMFRNHHPEIPMPGLWFARVDAEKTTLWVRVKGVDLREQQVEINVRQTVFYPDKPGRDYITVRGFAMRHAATPWAPPTAEQIGLLGTHWSKGWIIENNEISHSVCSGISLGKHGDEFDNTSADTAEGYVKTIERAQAHPIPWTKDAIGHHIVRNNTVSHCEQAGIVGSMGCAFSSVTDNTVHDIHVRRLFTGAEMAGIKFHGPIDTEISRNHIYRTSRGLWLDWMTQGTRVSRNLFHDNWGEDVFVEVDHGPFVFDNNLLLSRVSLLDMSQGGAFVHNLFAGKIISCDEPERETPYHPAHSTTMAGLSAIRGGDNRFMNNIFVGASEASVEEAKLSERRHPVEGYGLAVYRFRGLPIQAGGNVYLAGAQPAVDEPGALVFADAKPDIQVRTEGGRVRLQLTLPTSLSKATTALVTTGVLGKAKVSGQPYVDTDGSPLVIQNDYFGKRHSDARPTPGPFEAPGHGQIELTVRLPRQ